MTVTLYFLTPFLLTICFILTYQLMTVYSFTQYHYPHKKPTNSSATKKTFIPYRFKAKPQWVVKEVIRLCALMPHQGCRPVANTFNRLHEHKKAMTVSKSYVANKIKEHHYNIHDLRRNFKNKPAKTFPKNQQWALDLTHIDSDNTQQNLALGIIDCGTRFCLQLEKTQNKTSIALLRILFNTIEHHGKPKAIKTDNESCFTSTLFRFSLWFLGIKHQRSKKHCPWQNGKIERLFWTLKNKLKHYTLSTQHLGKELHQFTHWYNHCRPHQALKGKTPAEQHSGKTANQQGRAVYYRYWDGALTGFYLPPD